MGLVQKSFSDIITFSRSSNATRVGPTGVLEYAPHNLVLRSQEFDNASWTKDSCTASANAIAAPDGTVTADLITSAAATAQTGVSQTVTVAAAAHTLSCYIKPNGVQFVQALWNSPASSNYANFDISAGTVTAGTYTSATITSVGNGWYRITITSTLAAGSAGLFIWMINNGTASRAASFTGNGSAGYYLWGAQLSVGPYALDYTPTTSAAVYGPRFDYDGSGVTIVEPVSRNLVTYSQDFSNAAWTKRSITLTASQSSPDGGSSAFLAVPSTGASADMYNPVSASSAVYTVSVFAKASGKTWLYVLTAQGSGTSLAWFNVSTGVVGTVSGSGVTATITAAGNGWYRCTVTQTSASNYCQFGISDADNSLSVTGSGSNGILIWGAQLEVGSTATGYMVSGATNGFRAVPVVSGSATARGLLVEEQRTNLVTYSEDFSNAAWTKTGSAVIVANATAAPDGTITADKMTGSGACIASPGVSAGTYTLSVYAKADTSNFVRLNFYNGSSDSGVTFNLTTGALTNGYGSFSALATLVGSGWWRISITGTTATTTFSSQIYCDNSNSIYLWGAQVESGTFSTSYIPTLASTVTRSADVASVNTLSPWYNATEGTIYTESVSQANNRIAWFRNSATGTYVDFISSRLNNLFQGNSDVYVSGSLQSTVTTANAVNSSTLARIAAAYKANDFAISLNGGTVVTNTSGTIPAVNRLQIGWHDDGLYLNGHILRLAYYPRKLSSAELQALSA